LAGSCSAIGCGAKMKVSSACCSTDTCNS